MTYPQTIEYLYQTLPMFSHVGSVAYKKNLDNTIELCKILDQPQHKFKCIHVAGTNGKGSVSHMLASVFQCAGFKTGLYTSPHLYDFRERIKINGQMAEEDFVVDFVERIEPYIKKIEPSFFEITVVMAFDYFARNEVDIAIIEVGLGGRLDSTNVIIPAISVITNIGWDHMNLLGDTLEAIAEEKAGIIKQNIPVVVGEKKASTADVFERIARVHKSALYFAEDFFSLEDFKLQEEDIALAILNKKKDQVITVSCGLQGIYQVKNVITVLQVLALQNQWKISDEHIKDGLRLVKQLTGLHGRWEVIHKNPMVVLEVAHNKEGIEQMLAHLHQLHFDKLHIVIGMVKDKDVSQVLQLLPKDAVYYFSQSHIPRAMDAAVLQQKAAIYSLFGSSWMQVNDAIRSAMSHAAINDLIVVCGSIFLVAEVNKDLIVDQA